MDQRESQKKEMQKETEGIDERWGWIIVAGGGAGFSLIMGYLKSYSLVYNILIEKFQGSAAFTSGVNSLSGTLRMIASPLISLLCNKFGHLKVAFLAGIIFSLSFILSSFAQDLHHLYITFGVMQGIGACMFIVSTFSMVSLYFNKNIGKAISVLMCLDSTGPFYMVPVLQGLYENYSYYGTFFVLGALFLHLCAVGLLYRPLKLQKEETASDKKIPQIEVFFISKEPGLNTSQIQLNHHCEISTLHSYCNNNSIVENNIESNKVECDDHYQCLRCSSVILRLKNLKFLNTLCDGLGLGLLRNIKFLLLGMVLYCVTWILTMSWTFTAGFLEEKKFSKQEISLLFMTMSISGIPFHILSGFLFDLGPIKPHRMLAFSFISFIIGLTCICLPLIPGTYPIIVTWSFLAGLLGACNTQYITVISDMVPRSKITTGLGLIRLLQAIGALLGPFVGGLLYDRFGTHSYGFYIGGTQIILFSILLATRTLWKKLFYSYQWQFLS